MGELFNWDLLTEEDRAVARMIIGGANDDLSERDPDLVIAPDGKPYLYRWHILRERDKASIYFHVQVKSDPERPPHDHPWDNTSILLSAGGADVAYVEQLSINPAGKIYDTQEFERKPGDVIHRKAEHAHRLILPKGTPYTMSLFTCGPVRREWGFWTGQRNASHDRAWKWVPAHELIEARGNTSVQKKVEK